MTVTRPKYGPRTDQVLEVLGQLESIPWMSRVGLPTDEDAQLVRKDFHYLASIHEHPYEGWAALLEAENGLARLIAEHARLDVRVNLEAVSHISSYWPGSDDFYYDLDEALDHEYYADTGLYAHELIELPDRLLLGHLTEIAMADLALHQRFFEPLFGWLRRGHWPCGWEGDYPDGKLMLW